MEADERLEQLILRWQELHEAGRPVTARELCADCPELTETLQRSVQALAYWERFLRMDTVLEPFREATLGAFAPAFGKYRVVRRLGRGGQAATLLAFDPDLERHVVLKVFHQAHTPQEQEVVLREGRALARVHSPHVAQCLAAERQDGVPYLVVEYVAGRSLAERHRERSLTPDQAMKCVGQLAEGLAAVHACGLLHRDLKPGNVLVEGGDRPRLIDFGLAVPVASAALAEVAGTLAYMPPEQARGEAERIDPRTDVYGLGAILYELLTGRPPHQGATRQELWQAACAGDVVPPREVNRRVPRAVNDLCQRCLAKDPSRRFASAAELAGAVRRLQRWRRGRLSLVAAAGALALLAGLGGLLLFGKSWWPAGAGGAAPDSPAALRAHVTADDPQVLAVSKRPEDGGHFRTIMEALDGVEPGMTIRVLGDSDYEEYLLIGSPAHRGVVLEAAGKATLRKPPDRSEIVWIRGVPGFTLRGFHFESGGETPHDQIFVSGYCPGVILERLDMTTQKGDCISMRDVPLATSDSPIVIQNCTLRAESFGVEIKGVHHDGRPLPTGNVVIRNNVLVGDGTGLALVGVVHNVHVVGNRVLEPRFGGINLEDLLSGTTGVLIANNTLWRNRYSLRVIDDHLKKDFLKCNNVRIQNNLVLEPPAPVDMLVFDRARGNGADLRPGDVKALLGSTEWHFNHNWREIDQVKAAEVPNWIPGPNDHLEAEIKGVNRSRSHPEFLRPPKDSLLATEGAGKSDISLPAYVGAVPPNGVPPWDWQKTWDIQCRQLLTVSKDPAAGGHFRTITDALDKVEPGMTIRVLDDAVYEECLLITARHRGVVLEATSNATLHKLPDKDVIVWIRGVPGFALRGFRFTSSRGNHVQLYLTGSSPGVVLDHLDMRATNEDGTCVQLRDVSPAEKDAPIVIQNCVMRDARHAFLVSGQDPQNWDRAVPSGHVVIRNNTMVNCNAAVALTGSSYRVNVVGNRILGAEWAAIDCEDFLPGAADILVANNTLFRNHTAVRVWDDHGKGKEFLKCTNMRLQNNLILEPLYEPDMVLLNHTRARGGHDAVGPGDVHALLETREWRFSHNWREIDPVRAARDPSWIRGPTDHLQVPISVLSRARDDPNFLRPPKDSPLAWSGAGGYAVPSARVAALVGQATGLANPWVVGAALAQPISQPDRSLPAYVGAVSPEGVEPWDWGRTWKALAR
jgi:hypothetical protein